MAKILIVEDDPALQRLYTNTLGLTEHTLDLAGDGEVAMQKVAEFKPDLILLDIVMPKINGIEVLVNLKSNPETQNILIVVFTNAYSGKSIESAKAMGVTDFLVKSDTEPDVLLEHIERILRERLPAAA